MSKPFRSDKRKKELLRLKKQEEKRQRRFGAKKDSEGADEGEETLLETGEQPEEGVEDSGETQAVPAGDGVSESGLEEAKKE